MVSEQPNDEAIIEAIREQLVRLRAAHQDVGYLDAISVGDRGYGNVLLSGSVRRLPPFEYFGKATEILERLRGLPGDSGPEAIRSEFGRGH
jgi:hypothetical protein